MTLNECIARKSIHGVNEFSATIGDNNYLLIFQNNGHDFYIDLETIDYYRELITDLALCKTLSILNNWNVYEQ